jgi:hypothetical protein
MRKLFTLIIALVIVMAFTVTAHATDEALDSTNSTPAEEIAVESENIASESASENTVTDGIATYVKGHIEEISVIVSLIAAAIYSKVKDGKFGASLGTLNNNAITIAKDASEKMREVANKLECYEKGITDKLDEFEKKYGDLLGAFESDEEERLSFKDTLAHIEKLLSSVKLAATENSNEIANLILLSGIPNAKKDELYGDHLVAIRALEALEEGQTNDGEKA